MGLIDELKDIITLSKEAGISLSESISLYKMYQKDSSEDKKLAAKEEQEAEKTEQPSDGKERPDKALQNEPPAGAGDNVIDYKSKFEEMEKKLQKMQEENSSRDVSGSSKETDEELVNKLTQSYM